MQLFQIPPYTYLSLNHREVELTFDLPFEHVQLPLVFSFPRLASSALLLVDVGFPPVSDALLPLPLCGLVPPLPVAPAQLAQLVAYELPLPDLPVVPLEQLEFPK